MPSIKSRLIQIKQRILEAETAYQRPKGSVRLVAVSKNQTVESIRQAHAAGQRDFAENYLQEALDKIETLQDLPICWHFIGQIQSNKTRDIAQHFDWVHSVAKIQTAKRLNEQRPDNRTPLNICLQVNIDQETSKGGFTVEQLPAAIGAINQLPKLKLRGLMAIPQARQDFAAQRRPFQRLKQLLEQLKQSNDIELDTLSMGMSADLEAAIAEGATIVRIGTAIFGQRPE